MKIQMDNKGKCYGCAACANICPQNAIRMQRDEEGFVYPVIDEALCVECGGCASVCPIEQEVPEAGEDVRYYGFQTTDTQLLRESASGGAFSVLAGMFWKAGGNLICGAAMDEDKTVRHICCRSEEELYRLRNSKYVESEAWDGIGEVLRQLRQGSKVLFSGTPCQVDGLRQTVEQMSGNLRDNLLLVDIVCNGVGSPAVWSKYINALEKKEQQKVQSFRFRDKRAEYGRAVSWVLEDGAERAELLANNCYSFWYQRGFITRPSCYQCKYASLNRPGDITLGDFHGLQDEEFALKRGVSLVIGNTAKGREFCRQLQKEGLLKEYSGEQVLQPRLQGPIKKTPLRAIFMKDCRTLCWEDFMKKYGAIGGSKLR
ncbi:MAG: 4Fe-4S dicluster domain-containing protein [Lachnospiraceae bacterium]|nr:4Fe-4S dicluster domain-containing protein [Lachnospiraceae bacterium]